MRGAIFVTDAGAHQPESAGLMEIVRGVGFAHSGFGLRDAKDSLLLKHPLEHGPVARLKDEERQEGIRKKERIWQHHHWGGAGQRDHFGSDVFHESMGQ